LCCNYLKTMKLRKIISILIILTFTSNGLGWGEVCWDKLAVRAVGNRMLYDLAEKYGDESVFGSKDLEEKYMPFPKDKPASRIIADIVVGNAGNVLRNGEALYCNYVFILDTVAKKGAIIHTNNYTSPEFAKEVVREACRMINVGLETNDDRTNLLAMIARADGNSLPDDEAAQSKSIEGLFGGACDNLGIRRLETDVSPLWKGRKISFLIDEGEVLVFDGFPLSAEDAVKAVAHSINLYELAEQGRFVIAEEPQEAAVRAAANKSSLIIDEKFSTEQRGWIEEANQLIPARHFAKLKKVVYALRSQYSDNRKGHIEVRPSPVKKRFLKSYFHELSHHFDYGTLDEEAIAGFKALSWKKLLPGATLAISAFIFILILSTFSFTLIPLFITKLAGIDFSVTDFATQILFYGIFGILGLFFGVYFFYDFILMRIFNISLDHGRSVSLKRFFGLKDFIHPYAATSPNEFFAKSYEQYIVNSEEFREKAANNSHIEEQYDYLRDKVFEGVEYGLVDGEIVIISPNAETSHPEPVTGIVEGCS